MPELIALLVVLIVVVLATVLVAIFRPELFRKKEVIRTNQPGWQANIPFTLIEPPNEGDDQWAVAVKGPDQRVWGWVFKKVEWSGTHATCVSSTFIPNPEIYGK